MQARKLAGRMDQRNPERSIAMETFLDVVGVTALIFLALIGIVAGLIAAVISGGSKGKYIIAGVLGAVALPFILAALGVTAVIGAGLVVVLLIGIVGAVLIVALVKAVTGRDDGKRR